MIIESLLFPAFGHFTDFALGDQGPYRHLREGRSLERFAQSGPLLWRNYFDGGDARTWMEGDVVHLVVEGLEPELHHVYFGMSNCSQNSSIASMGSCVAQSSSQPDSSIPIASRSTTSVSACALR